LEDEIILSNNLVKVSSNFFGSTECDFWKNENDDIYMTAEQLGRALEYSDPRISVGNIVTKHDYLKDKEFSSVIQAITEVGNREMRVFTEDGIYEVLSISKQHKAREFRQWVRGVIKQIRKTGRYDFEEQRIMLIENEEERKLSINLLYEQRLYLNNPSDLTLEMRYKLAKNELDRFKDNESKKLIAMEVEKVKEDVEELKQAKDIMTHHFDKQNKDVWKKQIDDALKAIIRSGYVDKIEDIKGFTGKKDFDKLRNYTYFILERETNSNLNTLKKHKQVECEAQGNSKSKTEEECRKINIIYDRVKPKNLRVAYEKIVKELFVASGATVPESLKLK
jgi:prophage antirepressor-like protein